MLQKDEIKRRIDRNNEEIKAIFDPFTAILNRRINELSEENKNLQKNCIHQFEDGVCIYCYTEEEEGDNN